MISFIHSQNAQYSNTVYVHSTLKSRSLCVTSFLNLFVAGTSQRGFVPFHPSFTAHSTSARHEILHMCGRRRLSLLCLSVPREGRFLSFLVVAPVRLWRLTILSRSWTFPQDAVFNGKVEKLPLPCATRWSHRIPDSLRRTRVPTSQRLACSEAEKFWDNNDVVYVYAYASGIYRLFYRLLYYLFLRFVAWCLFRHCVRFKRSINPSLLSHFQTSAWNLVQCFPFTQDSCWRMNHGRTLRFSTRSLVALRRVARFKHLSNLTNHGRRRIQSSNRARSSRSCGHCTTSGVGLAGCFRVELTSGCKSSAWRLISERSGVQHRRSGSAPHTCTRRGNTRRISVRIRVAHGEQ